MTWEMILTVFAGLLVLVNTYNAVSGIFKKPASIESRLKALEEHEKNDLAAIRENKASIERLEKRVHDLEDKTEDLMDAMKTVQTELGMTLRALMQFITHIIDGGNNTDKLRDVRTEIYEYLLDSKNNKEG